MKRPDSHPVPPGPPPQQGEALYRYILDAIPQIVWTATPEGVQDFANLRWYEFNGLTVGEPDPEPWRSIIHPDDRETTASRWARSLATGEPYSCLHRNRRYDGQYRWVLSRAVPQKDETGRILRWIGSGTDITEQKLAEEEIIRYRDHLEDLVRERTAELEVAKERAEVASLAKSQFLASMSHELRTPLNAILGYAQILKWAPNLTEVQRQQVEVLRTSGEHLLMLINDVLDVGKMGVQRMELEESALDLGSLLLMVFHVAKIKAEEKELSFCYQAATPLPQYVRGDERKLKQVLLNLLNNAVKYTKRGSVLFQVEYGSAGAGIFRCEVRDTGCGIPPEKMEAIFEPFTQLALPGEPRDGTGLGLTITRELVQLMRGRLGVESVPEKGSTFWFELLLPSVAEPELPPKSEGVVLGYEGEPKCVLVVDDIAANAALLVSLLEPLGFRLLTASDGAEAVSRALEHRPDLVVIDLVMPGLNGLAAVEEMRRHPELAATRIVGASATVTDSALKNAFIAACDAFLEKPIPMDRLLEQISRLLGTVWIRSAETPLRTLALWPEAEAAPALPPLPAAELDSLRELAQRGDLRQILGWAELLEAKAPECAPWSDRVRALAAGFKVEAIFELAERHRQQRK